jgi:ABC-type uncharacterized transport system substrate-binding protein
LSTYAFRPTLAIKRRVPALYWLRSYTEAGGLMSCGADLLEVHRRSALCVPRILQRARPADLPVEEPTRLVLVRSLKTARAIGLTLRPDVRARAGEILQ